MKNELFYSLKKLKGILNYIIIITGDTVKCGVNIVIYATHTLKILFLFNFLNQHFLLLCHGIIKKEYAV